MNEQRHCNIVLFCSRPFEPSQVEPDFAPERAAATAAGFTTALFDHTIAAEEDAPKAVRRVPREGVPSGLGSKSDGGGEAEGRRFGVF